MKHRGMHLVLACLLVGGFVPGCGGGGGDGGGPVTHSITSLSPQRGSTSGGTRIVIQGSGFMAAGAGSNAVTVGGVPCTSVNTDSDTEIRCFVPAGTSGA